MHLETSTQMINIRPAMDFDAKKIAGLVNKTFRGETGLRAWTGEAHLLDGQRIDEDRVLSLIEKNSSAILVAESDQAGSKAVIGCVHVEKKGSLSYLGMLTVDVDLQKAGLGRQLLEEAERFARFIFQVDIMEMTVISVRTELIEWYERRGYSVTGEQRPFPYDDPRFGIPKRPDLEFVVLRKKLS